MVFFTDLAPSAPFRFTLHSSEEKPTPDVIAVCRQFLRTQWPSGIVRATWSTFSEPLESEEPCPFWGVNGSSLRSTFVHQLYVHPTAEGFQLEQESRMSYRLDEGVQSVQYLRVESATGAGCANNRPRNSGEMNIGQIWLVKLGICSRVFADARSLDARLVTLGREVMDLKSAAFILSLQVRQQFQAVDADRLLHYRFLVSYLSSWHLAREWLLGLYVLRSTSAPRVAMIHFSMRWLCPTEPLPAFVGFLLQREWGVLPKPGNRPAVSVREGRISLRFVSSFSIPPIFSTVILQDFPVDRSNLGPRLLDFKSPRIHIAGQSSISILQLALDGILEHAWYKGWVCLLDEIDDCVRIQVGVFGPPAFPEYCIGLRTHSTSH